LDKPDDEFWSPFLLVARHEWLQIAGWPFQFMTTRPAVRKGEQFRYDVTTHPAMLHPYKTMGHGLAAVTL
jgi:hypothetical protein